MKSFTAGPLVVKQTFSKSIQLNSIGWPHRDKTLLGIREPLVIPFQPEVLGCDKLTPVPLSMQTPKHFPGFLSAQGLDIDSALLALGINCNV